MSKIPRRIRKQLARILVTAGVVCLGNLSLVGCATADKKFSDNATDAQIYALLVSLGVFEGTYHHRTLEDRLRAKYASIDQDAADEPAPPSEGPEDVPSAPYYSTLSARTGVEPPSPGLGPPDEGDQNPVSRENLLAMIDKESAQIATLKAKIRKLTNEKPLADTFPLPSRFDETLQRASREDLARMIGKQDKLRKSLMARLQQLQKSRSG